jgi:esterase/lipase superfamily enzyme
MSLLEFGHAGARVIIFPTSRGTFHEWEDHGMMQALHEPIHRGWFHIFCVDCVDSESWYAYHKHPGARAWRQEEYDRYLVNELLPFTAWRNPHPYTIAVGASFGAYHALDLGFRHPERIQRILALSGLCDIRRFTDGYMNETIYYHNPMDFLSHEHDLRRLDALRRQNIILAVGKDDGLIHQNRQLSGVLWSKGIGNALREWDGFAHDWPVWKQMMNQYLGGQG